MIIMVVIYYCACVPLSHIPNTDYERTHQMHIMYNLVFNNPTYMYLYIYIYTYEISFNILFLSHFNRIFIALPTISVCEINKLPINSHILYYSLWTYIINATAAAVVYTMYATRSW